MGDFLMTVNSAKVWNFYNKHKNLDFENLNELFCDILENLVDNNLDSSIKNEILCSLKEQNSKISELKSSLQNMETSISNNILLKFVDLKRDYAEEVKTIISLNNTEKIEKIELLLEKQNDNLIQKTSFLLKDINSKNEDTDNNLISTLLRTLREDLTLETKNLLKTNNFDDIHTFISTFDVKCTSLFQTINAPVYNYITSSEERISKQLEGIKDGNVASNMKRDNVMTDLEVYLSKFNNSSLKGNISESQLEDVLNRMYPSAEIVNSSSQSGSGDLILKRQNKVDILLENKQYSRNINNQEVDKFVKDTNSLRLHGIFLSQSSGIVSKDNFQIDINNGCILVYLHSVNFDSDKIKSAVDIIDNLSSKLDIVCGEQEENSITSEVLESINFEFQSFLSKKDSIIASTKESQRKLVNQLEELTLMSLEKYLSTKFSFTKKGITCEICNSFTATNKRALSAHQRSCKNVNQIIQIQTK